MEFFEWNRCAHATSLVSPFEQGLFNNDAKGTHMYVQDKKDKNTRSRGSGFLLLPHDSACPGALPLPRRTESRVL